MCNNKHRKIISWKVNLDQKIKDAFIETNEKTLKVNELYLTDVALAVHINIDTSNHISFQVKQTLARILRQINGYAEQQGIFTPLMCIISPTAQKNSHIETLVNQWAADQDWHRGDFSLFYSSAEEAKEMLYSLLSSAATIWKEVEKMTPLTPGVYLQRLKNECKAVESTVEHQELINTIIRSWEMGESIGDAVMKWTTDSLSEINLLTEEEGE